MTFEFAASEMLCIGFSSVMSHAEAQAKLFPTQCRAGGDEWMENCLEKASETIKKKRNYFDIDFVAEKASARSSSKIKS